VSAARSDAVADVAFAGFGRDALAWLSELETHNERAWFQANKARYEAEVRGPMRALLGELEGWFGPGKVFRPNRDVRFARGKGPYKAWVGATVGEGGRVAGRYVQLDATHFLVAARAHRLEREALARYRAAVRAEASGRVLQRIADALTDAGTPLHGATLTRGPRDVPPDHPRLALLKHTSVTLEVRTPVGPWLEDPDAVLERVVPTLLAAEPLLGWLREHLA
jgi:uncharacterized protein (TIGR02453 family)